MPFDAGAIVGRLGLDISDYTRGMLQAQSLASLFPAVVTDFLANPLLGVVSIAKQATSALVDLFQGATNEADDMADVAANLGVSVEQLSALALAAKPANVELASVSDTLKFLQKNAAEALGGNETLQQQFNRLGLAGEQLRAGLEDPVSLLMDVADGMERLKTSGDRISLSEVIGRGGANMIGFLNQGSEAIRGQMEMHRRLGSVVTETQAESAGKWNDAMDTIGSAWLGFRNLLAEPLRDALLPYLEELTAWFRNNPDEVRAKAKEMADAIASAAVTIAQAARFIIENLRPVVSLMGALAGFKAGAVVGSVLGPAGAIVGGLVGAAGGAAAGFNAVSPAAQGPTQITVPVTVQRESDGELVRRATKALEEKLTQKFREMDGAEGDRQRRGGL